MTDPSACWASRARSPLPSPSEIPKLTDYFGSSDGAAIADDALKDIDNAAWLLYFPKAVRQCWYERIHWVRSIDRLAERDWLSAESQRFQQFRQHWEAARDCGRVPAESPYRFQLERMARTWGLIGDHRHPNSLDVNRQTSFSLQAWQRYLDAMATYHCHDLRVRTLADYSTLVDRLGGTLFQVFPELTADLAEGARAFGALDQCYNHLRDLYEDTQNGLCYFPEEVLERFGLQASDFVRLEVFEQPGYRALMEFWLCEYLPPRLATIERFARSTALPETWRCLCGWSLDRYRRIGETLQRCHYNYLEFSHDYWRDVRCRLLGARSGAANMPKEHQGTEDYMPMFETFG